jgi:hypothetical protein
MFTNFFVFSIYPETVTHVGHTDSVNDPTTTEGVSCAVRFAAAEVETANFRHSHRNRNFRLFEFRTPSLRSRATNPNILVTLHSGAIPVASSHSTTRAIQARRAWIRVKVPDGTAAISFHGNKPACSEQRRRHTYTQGGQEVLTR